MEEEEEEEEGGRIKRGKGRIKRGKGSGGNDILILLYYPFIYVRKRKAFFTFKK